MDHTDRASSRHPAKDTTLRLICCWNAGIAVGYGKGAAPWEMTTINRTFGGFSEKSTTSQMQRCKVRS